MPGADVVLLDGRVLKRPGLSLIFFGMLPVSFGSPRIVLAVQFC